MKEVAVWQKQVALAEPRFNELVKAGGKQFVDYRREAEFALQIIAGSKQLQGAQPESIQNAVTNLAAMGLSLNPSLQQAALVPRWNHKLSKIVCTAMPMYRGYIALASRTGRIRNIWGNAVYKWDTFEHELGTSPKIVHKKGRRPDDVKSVSAADIEYTYCCVEFEGSSHLKVTVLESAEILSVAARSDSFNPKKPDSKPSGPWITDPGQMAVKTAIRQSAKTWPGIESAEYSALRVAVDLDTEAETMDWSDGKDASDRKVVVSKDEIAEIESAIKGKGFDEITSQRFTTKVLRAYGVDSLAKLPADRVAEILARVKDFPAGPGRPAAEEGDRVPPPDAQPDPGRDSDLRAQG